MKAVLFHRYGGIDVLGVEDVEPRVVGARDVLVRRTAGINQGEAKIRTGALHERFPATFPSGQGSDLAGTIAEVGVDVSEWTAGDPVLGWSWACTASTRIFVQEGVREEFTERLSEAVAQFTVGDPFDPATMMGGADHPSVPGARHRVLRYRRPEGRTHPRRRDTIQRPRHPALVDEVAPDMRMVPEEIFGPVGALMGFTDVDDAVRKANQTEYGLASSVWTRDLATAHRVADGIDAGTVWVNTHHEMTTGAMPFEGFRQSGVGGEGGPEVPRRVHQAQGRPRRPVTDIPRASERTPIDAD